MSIYDVLVDDCPMYEAYVQHEFVQQLAAGTLPEAAFRYYLKQDYRFLIHFTRAWALALYKSEELTEIRAAQANINVLLDKELSLHVRYCEKWGITQGELETLQEHPATVAYTRLVLDAGNCGTVADLHIALAPCLVGYADIGKRLGAMGAEVSDRYGSWIQMYAGKEYQQAACAEREYLDRTIASVSERQQRLFDAATRMEIAFWQMGLDNGGH